MSRVTLGLGDLAVSDEPTDTLVATGLGSCVALVLFTHGVAGMAHIVVPGPPPAVSPVPKAGYYASTAVRALLDAVGTLAAGFGRRPTVGIIGGASVIDGLTCFDIGRRNVLAVRRALWAVGLVPSIEEVAGTECRSVTLDGSTGRIHVRTPSQPDRTLNP